MSKYLVLIFVGCIVIFSAKAQNQPDYHRKVTEGIHFMENKNYTQALSSFSKAYQVDSTNANINYKLGLCYLNSSNEKNKAFSYLAKAVLTISEKYSEKEANEKNAPINAYYYYGKALHLNYQFDEAIVNYEKFKSFLLPTEIDLIKDVGRQIEISNNAKIWIQAPLNIVTKNLGKAINSPYPDYNPAFSADEKTLIFTSQRPGSTGEKKVPDGQFYADIYISYKNDTSWTTPVSISPNINTPANETSIALSADAQTLLIYKDANGGDIYFSTLDGNNWTIPEPMGSDINSSGRETSACLTPDGNTLYFVSDRIGGFGGKDIWKCLKLPNGEWGKAQNMGASINTQDDEESPFIHPSGNVLFFSSKGHSNIGGFDIFYSMKNGKDWEQPMNIGYPINTVDDDLCYVTSPDGKRGYSYSASRPGNFGEKDIYEISMPKHKEQPLVLIKGLIIPAENEKISDDIEIVVTNTETDFVIGTYKPLMRDGSFSIIIPPNSHYSIVYQKNGAVFFSELMDVPANAVYQEIERDIHLKPVNIKK